MAKTLDYALKLLGIALLQAFFFMIVVFLFERFGIIALIVASYNETIFYPGETGIIFFVVFIISEFLANLVRSALILRLTRIKSLPLLVIIISFLQTILLLFILGSLQALSLINIGIGNINSTLFPFWISLLWFWILIIIPESIYEMIIQIFFKKPLRS